jgi:hypothetical protein
MENNIYREFFEELKMFILNLGIEKEEKVQGCTEDEIQQIEEQFGELPLAYKEYLKTIGRKFLFSFFNAEQFSYEDYEDIQEFTNEVIENTNFASDKKLLPISHRRYEYVRFIYLETGEDDPLIWYLVEDPDEDEGEVNPIPSEKNLTEIMTIFFSATLRNHPFSFNWVTDEEEKENPNIIEDRFTKWLLALHKIKNELKKTNNPLINDLHEIFLNYYDINKESDEEELDQKEPTELHKDEKYTTYTQINNTSSSGIKYKPQPEDGLIDKLLRFMGWKW